MTVSVTLVYTDVFYVFKSWKYPIILLNFFLHHSNTFWIIGALSFMLWMMFYKLKYDKIIINKYHYSHENLNHYFAFHQLTTYIRSPIKQPAMVMVWYSTDAH